MSKENVLFSIIGVLLGFIVGFIFANAVNQNAPAPRVAGGGNIAGTTSDGLPADHPQLPTNAVRDQQALQTAAEQGAKQAKDQPNNFEAQVRAADLYGQAGRYDDALDYLLRANELRPDNYEVVVQLGNANYEANRFEAAERWYTAALMKKPSDVNVRTDLGLTFFLRKPPNVDRAIEEFRRSLQYEPQHELTLQNITVALTSKGDAEQAQTMLTRLEQLNPNNRALPSLRRELEKVRASGKS